MGELEAQRTSLFTVGGMFVQCVGAGVLKGGGDVAFSALGEVVASDANNDRVCVFGGAQHALVRSWGCDGDGDGQFQRPTALAVAGTHLYVMDEGTGRVQMFE